MANGPDHLTAEYNQLVEFLELYPNISIARADGEPPDEYEITYTLRAYTIQDNEIRVASDHRILITLPFGYPHFAPVVKALSPLFHPAIEQSSIAIEAQWRKNPSLPDLVVYLAEMITGHIYLVENPVNAEAVRYYEEHRKELPLDTPTIADMEEDSLIGMLEDEFDPAFNLDEDIHALDDTDVHEAEIQEIRELLAKNQLFTLNKRLADLPPGLWFPEREEAEQLVESAREKAAHLFVKAQELEDEGRYGKALECAHAILTLIPDDPAAKALADRLQQSSFITESLTDALNEQEDIPLDLQTDKQQAPLPPPPAAKPPKGPRRPLLPADFPLRRILLAVLGLVLALWLGMHAMGDWSVLSRVRKGIQEAQTQLQARQYADAKDTLERTRNNIGGLTLLWFRESSLHKEVDTLLNSPELKEGAQGRVLYQGKYVDEATANALKDLAQLEQQGQALAESKQYDAALEMYNKALQQLGSQPLPEEAERLNTKIRALEAERFVVLAAQAAAQKKWDDATGYYRQLDTLLQGSSDLKQQFGTQLSEGLAGTQLAQSLDKTLSAAEKGQLNEARQHVQEAEQILAANTQNLSSQSQVQLDAAKVQLQMYAILPEAKKAFEARQWQQAVHLYQQAVDTIEKSRPEVRPALQDAQARLRQTLELARMYQSLEQAALAVAQKDWASAVRLENAALARLNRSGSGNDPQLAGLKRSLEKQLAQHRRELDLAGKAQWLETRALSFFSTHYPTFKEEDLSRPKAVFLRREGSKQIFELSCLESSGGRPSKLVLHYAYDEKNGQWGIFRGQ